MTTRIVVADRRFRQMGNSRKETKLLVEIKDSIRRNEIPRWVEQRYNNNPASKKFPYYVEFRGLKPTEAKEIYEVGRGTGKILFGINRMGYVNSWKLRR